MKSTEIMGIKYFVGNGRDGMEGNSLKCFHKVRSVSPLSLKYSSNITTMKHLLLFQSYLCSLPSIYITVSLCDAIAHMSFSMRFSRLGMAT